MSKQIFSKIAKIGEEARAAQPMKVSQQLLKIKKSNIELNKNVTEFLLTSDEKEISLSSDQNRHNQAQDT